MIELICLMLLGVTLFLMCLFMFTDGTLSKKFGGKSLLFIAVLFVGFAFVFKKAVLVRKIDRLSEGTKKGSLREGAPDEVG